MTVSRIWLFGSRSSLTLTSCCGAAGAGAAATAESGVAVAVMAVAASRMQCAGSANAASSLRSWYAHYCQWAAAQAGTADAGS